MWLQVLLLDVCVLCETHGGVKVSGAALLDDVPSVSMKRSTASRCYGREHEARDSEVCRVDGVVREKMRELSMEA